MSGQCADGTERYDPHSQDYCVVCRNTPTVEGPPMHPVVSIENGYVCQRCVESNATKSDGDRVVILDKRRSHNADTDRKEADR